MLCTRYNYVTGEVLMLLWVPTAEVAAAQVQGESDRIIEGHYPAEAWYFEDDTPAERPANPAHVVGSTSIDADGVDELLIEDIPDGSAVAIEGPTTSSFIEAVIDGELVITTDDPGTHIVRIRSFPELDTEITFDAS